jgi:GT2 family glycosyltransferase
MSEQRPRISVVIPAYGCRTSIGDVIAALRAQTTRPTEIIVVDDCSPDGLAETLAPLRDEITVLQNPRNLGLSRTFNRGLREASGEFVLTLHSDCILASDYLERLWRILDAQPGVGAVTGQYDLTDFADMTLSDQLFCVLNRLPLIPDPLAPELEEIAFVEGKADLFRTREIAAFGHFTENLRLTAEDQDLSARYRRAGFSLLQVNAARFHSKYNATQDSLWKVLRKQYTYARGQAYVLLRYGWDAVKVTTRNRNTRAFHRMSQVLWTAAVSLSLVAGFFWPLAFVASGGLVLCRLAYYAAISAPLSPHRRLIATFIGLAADACYTIGLVQGVVLTVVRGSA